MAILRVRSSLQLGSRNAAIRIPVALARRLHHLVRQRRRRRLSIPLSLLLQARQVVAQRLLVEAWLALARLIAVGRPKPRGIGSEDLVDDDQVAVGRGPELELRVGDDDTALRRVIATGLVQRETRA